MCNAETLKRSKRIDKMEPVSTSSLPLPVAGVFSLLLFVLLSPLQAEPKDSDLKSKHIELHAIVEASVDDVWKLLVDQREAGKWLWNKALVWQLEPGKTWRATMHGGDRVEGEVFKVEDTKAITITWDKPATMVTFTLRALDDYLTMVTIKHEGFSTDVPSAIKQMEELRLRWIVSLMKLHRQAPVPVVDTRYHRPRDAKGLFVDRSLVINGDFHYTAEPGRYEGVAFGWETNTAKPSPQTHRIDEKSGGIRPPSQLIANPPDWTHHAIQQFTSHLAPMVQPGKRYRLTGWVRTEGIQNPAGWYTLGLWFTDMSGKPIGDTIKNPKRTDDQGDLLLNDDWHEFRIEAVAPPKAARAVVILPGHWDESGKAWYDDIQLWEVEKPTTGSKRRR